MPCKTAWRHPEREYPQPLYTMLGLTRMKQFTWIIMTLAGAAACGSAAGQEQGSRESRGVIKTAPDRPSAGHVDPQSTFPVPEPAREPASVPRISNSCASADKDARSADNVLNPPTEGRVIGKGRLHFHAAPTDGCRSRNRFIIPGDAIVARRLHGEWLLIDYVARDGVIHSAWVKAVRIDLARPAAKH